jgi:HlyD family secretion protein
MRRSVGPLLIVSAILAAGLVGLTVGRSNGPLPRRRSVVSLRFEGFIDTVENVTTGTHVHKGEPLMRIYGPNLSSAAAEYLSALNARSDAA